MSECVGTFPARTDVTIIPADTRDFRSNKTPPRKPSKFRISFNNVSQFSMLLDFLRKSKIKPQIISRKNLYIILSDVDFLMLDSLERFECKVEEDFEFKFFGETNEPALVGFTKYTPVQKIKYLHGLMETAIEWEAEKNAEMKETLALMMCDELLDIANGDTDGLPRIYEMTGIIVLNDYCVSKIEIEKGR